MSISEHRSEQSNSQFNPLGRHIPQKPKSDPTHPDHSRHSAWVRLGDQTLDAPFVTLTTLTTVQGIVLNSSIAAVEGVRSATPALPGIPGR